MVWNVRGDGLKCLKKQMKKMFWKVKDVNFFYFFNVVLAIERDEHVGFNKIFQVINIGMGSDE